MHSYRSIILAMSGALYAAPCTRTTEAQIIPVSQQRNITADSIVSAPSQQDIDFMDAPDFNEFSAQVFSEIANANALASTSAWQQSSISGCAITAVGNAVANGMSTDIGFHGYSVGSNSCRVVFDITQTDEYLIAGWLNSTPLAQARMTLQTITNQLVFDRTKQDGTLYVHHRITLAPGRYIVTYSGVASVAVNNGPIQCEVVSYEMSFTSCFVPEDINVDGTVGVTDLLGVINGWGACPAEPLACAADVDLNGGVGVPDLLAVINAWGSP